LGNREPTPKNKTASKKLANSKSYWEKPSSKPKEALVVAESYADPTL